ncbi:hypothetical protein O163_09645 [Caldanaerobacter subterraneus subsp. yonseiensis KB-1]|uniref:Uncharacterized protein n=1 Tax=Caldanaerobacter subterraneus subsp. yonseiensis KB-1 TaxID=1388761 RepID=U5CFC7_CALSX|nr:hypothetical protein [Caldanaerobacter subterraneus]ERM91630.1 hypothetical protein O163_09645 [Caldanaerobacter subterraneus subsp. yonseiensis KB-1]
MRRIIVLLIIVISLLGTLAYVNIAPAYMKDKKVVRQYLVAEEREPRIHGDINNPWGG